VTDHIKILEKIF